MPDAGPIRSEGDLWNALLGLGPRLVTYFLSFLTLGIFWNGQQTQLNLFGSADRDLTWLQLAFLATVALLPFSTSLLAEFITYRLALLAYWANILLLGVLLYAAWIYDAPPHKRSTRLGALAAIDVAMGLVFGVVLGWI